MIDLVYFGVILSCIIASITIGFTLTLRIWKFFNCLHPGYMTMGAYLTYLFNNLLGYNVIISVLISTSLVGLIGLAIGIFLYFPLRDRPVSLMIMSLAGLFTVTNTLELFFGSEPVGYIPPVREVFHVGPIHIRSLDILIIIGLVLALSLLMLFLSRTKIGTNLRAVSDSYELAVLRGVNTNHVLVASWLIISMLAAIGGTLLGWFYTLTPYLGLTQIVTIFAVAIVGGLGSIYGTIIAAFIIGIPMELATLILPSGYKMAIAFLALIIVTIFKPREIFMRARAIFMRR